MSDPILPSESGTVLIKKSAETGKGFQAWRYRSPSVANFTRQVHDFPNATVSIHVGPSAGWMDLLAGITNVSVGILSGTDLGTEIGINQIVGTGVFRGIVKQIPLCQGMHAGSILFEGSADALCLYDEAVTLLGSGQQITLVEPVDAAKLAQRAVLQEHSLSAQLRRLSKL